MRSLPIILVSLLVVNPGCGSSKEDGRRLAMFAAKDKSDARAPLEPAGAANRPANLPEQAQQEREPEKVARKIKYTAEIRLIADDFAKPETAIPELVKTHQGYVASTEITGTASSGHRGMWRVRIPVKEFDVFRSEVLKLGEVEKNRSDSEDVTEQYFDLENHIKNQEAELEGLRKLQEQAADFLQKAADKDKIQYFLSLRQDISKVRDEMQRDKGRLKLLANLTDLTTVTIHVQEKLKYLKEKAPELAEKPGFGVRAEKTFEDSVGALKDFGQGLAIFGVAVAPWLPLALVVAVPAWIAIRRRMKTVKTPPPPITPVSSPQT